MVTLVLKNATSEIRGKIRKYLYEVDPGIFTGTISSSVQDALWKQIVLDQVNAILISTANTEQGFSIRKNGEFNRYDFVDVSGIMLSAKRKTQIDISDLYAKPNKQLLSHLLETGFMAEQIMRVGVGKEIIHSFELLFGMEKDILIESIAFLCALHDIGMAHPGFQDVILDSDRLEVLKTYHIYEDMEPIRHERYSRDILERNLKYIDEDFISIVAYHHQGKDSNHFSNRIRKPKSAEWERLQMELINNIETHWKFDSRISEIRKYRQGFTYCILAIMITSDWIVSGEKWAQYLEEHKGNPLDECSRNFLFEQKLASAHTFDSMIQGKTFFDIFEICPNIMQQTVISMAQQGFDLMIIEAPCGMGKTQAGCMAAFLAGKQKNGIYMAMPSMATIKNMLPRVRSIMKNLGYEDPIPEFDSSSIWSDDSEDRIDKELWVSASRHQMLYPSAVGTIDQLLKTISTYKYAAIGILGLANKAIIIDEIHSYDAYIGKKIERLLEYCKMLHVPVILLSATLDDKTKLRYIKSIGGEISSLSPEYPLITSVTNGVIKEETFNAEGKDIPIQLSSIRDIQEGLIEEARTKKIGCTAVIAPTVDSAIYIYDQLRKDQTNISLYHSRDTVENKERKAAELFAKYGRMNEKNSNRPDYGMCIATSAIEMSLDVDFDYLSTSICPIDILIQRIGRWHRHDDKYTIREKGLGFDSISVITSEEKGKLNYVYDSSIIEATEKVLRDLKSFNTVKDVRRLINTVYNDPEKLEDRIQNEYLKYNKAEALLLNSPYKEYELNITPYNDGYASFNSSSIAIREEAYPTKQIAIVSSDDLVGDEFTVSKRIIKSRTVNVATYKLDEFGEGEHSTNHLIEHIALYESNDYKIRGRRNKMIISEEKGLFFVEAEEDE